MPVEPASKALQRRNGPAAAVLPRVEDHPTLKELICQALREHILNGDLAPGTRLVEAELAAQFGVSKTPVREALLTLEAEGLVTVRPHRGAEVASFSLEQYRELQFVRDALEFGALDRIVARIGEADLQRAQEQVDEMAAAFAADDYWRYRRAQRRLHEVLLSAAGSPLLVKLALSLSDRMVRYGWMEYAHQRDWWAQELEISRQRVALLRRRDAAGLRAMLEDWHARFAEHLGQRLAAAAPSA